MKYLLLLPIIFCACSKKSPTTHLALNDPWQRNNSEDYQFFGPPIYEPHPRDAGEIQEENDDEQYRYKREVLDNIDPENAPHTTEDAKNFA